MRIKKNYLFPDITPHKLVGRWRASWRRLLWKGAVACPQLNGCATH